jgi:hypothetical protein
MMSEPLLDLQPVKLVDESKGVFDGDAHALLIATYQGKYVPSHQQLRAAFKAIEYERPRLQATAILHDENSFAVALDRAIQRSREGKVTLELSANAPATNGAGEGDGRG